MKRNDAEPQRESRSVEDKKKLTKVVFFFKREREEYCLQKSRLAPSFEERRREIESERERERESSSNQSQWTRWREQRV